jgi:SEC-C motif-containing protein
MSCFCGETKDFKDCCGRYISGQEKAGSALALMRSRYSAFVIEDMEYIQKTMFESLSKDGIHLLFIKLEIINASFDQVEFKAFYIHRQKLGVLHELSNFKLQNGQWIYTHGQLFETPLKPISLNKPCPCGSGQKFKNCSHGL